VPFGAELREATTLIAVWVSKIRPERSPWPAGAAFGATKSVRAGAGIYPIRHTHALDTAGTRLALAKPGILAGNIDTQQWMLPCKQRTTGERSMFTEKVHPPKLRWKTRIEMMRNSRPAGTILSGRG
jgi:hypothetical protein